PGRFPLVLYSAGWFNRAPDNTVLAEYLASHGFVVAAVPQLNPGLWTFNFHSDFNSVENQTRDLEFALGTLSSQSFVDRTRVAVMGYSTGGDVVLLLQERNELIDAVVGLDASWSLDPDNDVAGSPFFSAERSEVPILALRRPQTESSRYDVVLDALKKAPRVVAEIPGADHGSFSDDPPERRYLGLDTGEHETAHTEIARATLAFLRAALEMPGTFDGTKLAQQLQARGLKARYLPATDAKPDEAKK
ncbi:MAG TPA: dienelactone hydrolase family protein, partial [Candidatus Krumholzibacteria bacterium]|nr:dienelactone hydrolase family protein [Candidatus Krumholzibacteria bacterium]